MCMSIQKWYENFFCESSVGNKRIPKPFMTWENYQLMMGGVLATKYFDPGSPVVNVKINNTLISNSLIDLGVAINIMTHETMKALGLTGLGGTPTVVQLADRSTIKLEGILEYVVISVDSWEYPTDFMVLQPKTSLGGYPLIFG
jgi:hypothetical protein